MGAHSRNARTKEDKRKQKQAAKAAKKSARQQAKREEKEKAQVVETKQQTGDSPDDLTKGEPVSTIESPSRVTVIASE